jgi:hypothetical protein
MSMMQVRLITVDGTEWLTKPFQGDPNDHLQRLIHDEHIDSYEIVVTGTDRAHVRRGGHGELHPRPHRGPLGGNRRLALRELAAAFPSGARAHPNSAEGCFFGGEKFVGLMCGVRRGT